MTHLCYERGEQHKTQMELGKIKLISFSQRVKQQLTKGGEAIL